jgi:hypothetical protein
LNGAVPTPEAVAAALVRAHAGPVEDLAEGHRLIDYAESSRTGEWSLRSALVRFAQPEPVRAGAVLELIRRTDGALKPHRRRLESASVPTHPALGPELLVDDAEHVAVRGGAAQVVDAPAADLARAVRRLPDGDAVASAYLAAVGHVPTAEAVPLLVVALHLDDIAEALVAWASVHDGPPPVDIVDELAAAAFARLGELGVARETGGRPRARTRRSD